MHYQKYGRSIPTETQRFINTLRKHGLTGKINYPLLPQTPAPNTLEKLNGPNKPIAFLIGGKLQPKKWPLEHWASLASLIGPSETILLIGGEAETEEAVDVEEVVVVVVVSCCGYCDSYCLLVVGDISC